MPEPLSKFWVSLAQFSEIYWGKLSRYQVLGVPEVWFWQDGTFELYHLSADGYQRIERSQLPGLEELDIELLQRCVLIAEADAAEAIRTFLDTPSDQSQGILELITARSDCSYSGLTR